MRLTGYLMNPVAGSQKTFERRTSTPDQRSGFNKIAAIGDEIPVSRKPSQALHGGEVDQAGPQDFVRGVGAVDHLPGLIMPDDRRAAEALEHADLDFLGVELYQPIESSSEAFHVFTRQADDQIGVHMYAGFSSQPPQVLFHFHIVLPATDQLGD